MDSTGKGKDARGTAARMLKKQGRRQKTFRLGLASILTALLAVGVRLLVQKQSQTPGFLTGKNHPISGNWPTAWVSQVTARPLGTIIDGITCDTSEGVVQHSHQYLTFIINGRIAKAPGSVGIDDATQCLYWLHSHNPDGIIHLESPQTGEFMLGEFLDIWRSSKDVNKSLLTEVVAKEKPSQVWVNGQLYTGNLWTLPLTSREQITIEYGQPTLKPQPFTFPAGM